MPSTYSSTYANGEDGGEKVGTDMDVSGNYSVLPVLNFIYPLLN